MHGGARAAAAARAPARTGWHDDSDGGLLSPRPCCTPPDLPPSRASPAFPFFFFFKWGPGGMYVCIDI